MPTASPDMVDLARWVRALKGLDDLRDRCGVGVGNIRAVSWNLDLGGVDGVLERRLRGQSEVLAALRPDVLALQECTFWDADEERRLLWMADVLGMVPVRMEPSRLGDGRNHTALLYRPSALRLIGRRTLGAGVYHHALIRARLRLVHTRDDRHDVLVFATHLTHLDGDRRLAEARCLTDYAGPLPGMPDRALLLGDFHCSDPDDVEPVDWECLPRNLHARHRLIAPDGSFGPMDRRALAVLVNAGWIDPQSLTGRARAATVGHGGEGIPLRLDHILVRGLPVESYRTHDTPEARAVSDHLPVVLDTSLMAPRLPGQEWEPRLPGPVSGRGTHV
ncbi:endonuclease/exonuclease/phosphatase family protein [Streptomyces sp. NPDC059076]|uniref:endonuclease/exonuclease/phosphatase family protein n=1 Tax=unclassified Streptomyces TaxID=2593676 RepID=UPI00367A26BF